MNALVGAGTVKGNIGNAVSADFFATRECFTAENRCHQAISGGGRTCGAGLWMVAVTHRLRRIAIQSPRIAKTGTVSDTEFPPMRRKIGSGCLIAAVIIQLV